MDDDALLDAVADQAAELADLGLPDLLPHLQALVRQTLTARRPDGTWPAVEVLAEALRAHLALLDGRLAADHPATLDAMLATLRDELGDGVHKVPTYPPPAELHVIDPSIDPAGDP